MSKKKMILLIAAAGVVLYPAWMYISFVGSTEALCRRFPDVDPEVVYQVHKEIFFETLKGQHRDVNDDADGSTGEFDKIFWKKVHKIERSQKFPGL